VFKPVSKPSVITLLVALLATDAVVRPSTFDEVASEALLALEIRMFVPFEPEE